MFDDLMLESCNKLILIHQRSLKIKRKRFSKSNSKYHCHVFNKFWWLIFVFLFYAVDLHFSQTYHGVDERSNFLPKIAKTAPKEHEMSAKIRINYLLKTNKQKLRTNFKTCTYINKLGFTNSHRWGQSFRAWTRMLHSSVAVTCKHWWCLNLPDFTPDL